MINKIFVHINIINIVIVLSSVNELASPLQKYVEYLKLKFNFKLWSGGLVTHSHH